MPSSPSAEFVSPCMCLCGCYCAVACMFVFAVGGFIVLLCVVAEDWFAGRQAASRHHVLANLNMEMCAHQIEES